MKHMNISLTFKQWAPRLLILGVVIALALSCGLVLDFDADIGHFSDGSPAFYLLTAALIAVAAVSAVLGRKARGAFSLARIPEHSLLSLTASAFAALMAVVSAAAELFDFYVLRPGTGTALSLLAAALLPAVAVAALTGIIDKTAASNVRVTFLILSVLAVTAAMFACYFDFTLPLNSPVRNVTTLTQGGVLLLLLSETRLALDPVKRADAPFFTFANAFAAAVTVISFGMIVFGFVSPDAAAMGVSIYRFSCYFGLGLLGLARLRNASTAAVPYVPPVTDGDKPAPDPDTAEPDRNLP